MTAQWLCEPERITDLPWFFDAPWEAANQRNSHKWIACATGCNNHVVTSYAVGRLAPAGKDALRQLIYGNPVAQDMAGHRQTEMVGLATHFASRDPEEAQNAVNVLDAGGTHNLSSAWLIGWGPRTVFMVSPDGDPVSYSGECCVAVADWRYVVRIANIDAALPELDVLMWMCEAVLHLPKSGSSENVRPIFYVNGDVENRIKDRFPEIGTPYYGSFRNIPIRRVDELRSDEARV